VAPRGLARPSAARGQSADGVRSCCRCPPSPSSWTWARTPSIP
jgi:hypothetical protein